MAYLTDRPILYGFGLLLSAITLLAFASMLSSAFVAETTHGMATAVNQAGSLRMQSYRIVASIAQQQPSTDTSPSLSTNQLVAEFEERFRDPRLSKAIPLDNAAPLRRLYRTIGEKWSQRIKPLFTSTDEKQPKPILTNIATPAEASQLTYWDQVDDFVESIDSLVYLLEEHAESKLAALRIFAALCLVLSIVIVIVTLFLGSRKVLFPLHNLLEIAAKARHGDFSVRSRYTSNDELGRLGQAFNVMAEDLLKMYTKLEQRVQDQTKDLEQSNQSLELLYATQKRLNETPVSEHSLVQVLDDIETRLALGPGTVCLRDDPNRGTIQIVATSHQSGPVYDCCRGQGCNACDYLATSQVRSVQMSDGRRANVMSFPIRDKDSDFGVLLIDLREELNLSNWQHKVLETVAAHIGLALNIQCSLKESRRLALHEERNVIARELHDSLAQSLSYLKIQVSRLDTVLSHRNNMAEPRAVLAELRGGVNSAYRQLRELLVTFRLKMDGRGLHKALSDTVLELQERSATKILLDNQLSTSLLSPHEEIHVLQIVREALTNVVRHAQAGIARVKLIQFDRSVQVTIEDNGHGLDSDRAGYQHHGLTIMRERALSLDGEISISTHPPNGTRIQLEFVPQAVAAIHSPVVEV